MHLESVMGKILNQNAFGILQHAHSETRFLEILHLESFNQDICKHVSVTKEFSTEVQRLFLSSITYNSPLEITYLV
jgi:hypothetical protein